MRSYGLANLKFLLMYSYVLYTAMFAFLYDHNKQQQRKYEGWIPYKTKLSTKNHKEIYLRSSSVFLSCFNAQGAYGDVSSI